MRGITLPDDKTYQIATIMVGTVQRNRYIDQCNKINPEIDAHTQLILDKAAQSSSMEKGQPSQQMKWNNWTSKGKTK